MKAMMAVVEDQSIVMLEEESQIQRMSSSDHTSATVQLSSVNQKSIVETKVSLAFCRNDRTLLHHCMSKTHSRILFMSVILPTSALHELARLRIQYPMTFMISNSQMGLKTYCGVLEFSAEEGMCHIPIWMMNNLCIEEGSEIILRNMNLQKGTYIKIQPHETAFIDLADPKAM